MEVDGQISGGKLSRVQIKQLGDELGRSFVSIALQEARALTVDLGRYTLPLGLKANDGNALKKKIRQDIMRIFPSIDDGDIGAVRIYGLLEAKSPDDARAFWTAHKSGDREEMENVLAKRIAGVPKRMNRAVHKAARRGKYGRVPHDAIAYAVVNARTRESYIRKAQKNAGMAKAGWLGAGRGLGGRVRRGGGRSGGTSEVFPAWVRKAGARRKLGSASVTGGRGRLRIILRNSVRHAEEALPVGLQAVAENAAQARFVQSLLKAKAYSVNKARRKMRAS